jgi:MOSC domain-containing protein YiiM
MESGGENEGVNSEKPPALRLLSVNRARAQPLRIDGREVLSGIVKRAVEGRVAVGRLGLEGDEQADLSVHGGLHKAVYAYPHEHYAFWQTVRAQAGVAGWGEPLPMGAMGENLTIAGVGEDSLFVGDRFVLPDCVLAVGEPRFPCFKFNAAMGFKHAAKMMVQSGFCGAYLTVIEPGTVAAGDRIEHRPGPREVAIRDLFRSRARG